MPSQLEQLKQFTTIVADTGDIEAIYNCRPQDATTNPSLILAAVQNPAYAPLIKEAILQTAPHKEASSVLERLLVIFGCKILAIIPGRVSTEIDAHLSFDTMASVAQARRLIQMYETAGIDRSRVLIKLASTWEGIEAAKILESEGIHCNMTLLFCLEQAAACAHAHATLISPFVGRIFDWYKAKSQLPDKASHDPGVISVKQIYSYYKQRGYKTQVMGASFRNVDQILELAGCDLLTISPHLIQQLQDASGAISRKLQADPSSQDPIFSDEILSESQFRFKLNDNAMACEKLAEGIRLFARDTAKLLTLIQSQL